MPRWDPFAGSNAWLPGTAGAPRRIEARHRRVRLSLRPWAIVLGCPDDPGVLSEAVRIAVFHGCEDSRAYLRRWSGDEHVLRGLRTLAGRESPPAWRRGDDWVIDRIAVLLVQRRLVVTESVVGWERAAAPETEPPPPVELPKARPKTQAPPPPPPPETDPLESLDQDPQAATLELAAEAGVAFCEECDKARRAAEAAQSAIA